MGANDTPVWIAPSAKIHVAATVANGSRVAAGATVAEGATILPGADIGENARIGRRALIKGQIGADTEIGEWSTIAGDIGPRCKIGTNVAIPTGMRIPVGTTIPNGCRIVFGEGNRPKVIDNFGRTKLDRQEGEDRGATAERYDEAQMLAGWDKRRELAETTALLVHPDAEIGKDSRVATGSTMAKGAWIGNDVQVDAANLRAGAAINDGTRIELGAQIDARIGANTRIGANAVVDGPVGTGTEVGQGCRVERGTRVPDNARLAANQRVRTDDDDGVVIEPVDNPSAIVETLSGAADQPAATTYPRAGRNWVDADTEPQREPETASEIKLTERQVLQAEGANGRVYKAEATPTNTGRNRFRVTVVKPNRVNDDGNATTQVLHAEGKASLIWTVDEAEKAIGTYETAAQKREAPKIEPRAGSHGRQAPRRGKGAPARPTPVRRYEQAAASGDKSPGRAI